MNGQHERERHLRQALRNLPPHEGEAIRNAYYKAIEGLQALARALDVADREPDGARGEALLAEHYIACQALEAMNTSQLGRIL